MEVMEGIKKKLETQITKDTRDEARRRKDHNIEVFSKLSRDGLYFGRLERRILLGTTSAGEKVYVQYPGKESGREGDKVRPWDLRPKVEFLDGKFLGDISFKDIWNDLIELYEKDPELLPLLAAVLYRLSMLMDHELVVEGCEFIDVDMSENIKNKGTLNLKHYKYSPDREVIDYLSERIGKIGGMSYEAYMLVNDYLAQNEDCKYYYRDVILNKGKWDGKIGRYNNLMTHVMIIGFLRGKIKFTDVTDQFQRMRGVAPIPEKSLPEVSDNLLFYEKGELRPDKRR